MTLSTLIFARTGKHSYPWAEVSEPCSYSIEKKGGFCDTEIVNRLRPASHFELDGSVSHWT